jgi:hypothetical protein
VVEISVSIMMGHLAGKAAVAGVESTGMAWCGDVCEVHSEFHSQ